MKSTAIIILVIIGIYTLSQFGKTEQSTSTVIVDVDTTEVVSEPIQPEVKLYTDKDRVIFSAELTLKSKNLETSVGGKDNTILYIKSIVIDEEWCNQFAASTACQDAFEQGFTVIYAGNGINKTWPITKQ